MKRFARPLAAVTLALATVLPIVPAAAFASDSGGLTYRYIPCPVSGMTATTSTIALSAEPEGAARLQLSGEFSLCRTLLWNEVVGVGVYRSDGTAKGAALGWNRGEVPISTTFAYEISIGIRSTDTAVCVLGGERIRLACVGLAWAPGPVSGALLPIAAGPIPVDSPVVSAPAVTHLAGFIFTGGPGCATCWPVDV